MTALQRRRLNENVTINHAELIPSMRNFAGVVTPFNQRGDREFVVSLADNEQAIQELLEVGYDLKELKAREEGDQPTPILRVRAFYPDPNKGQRGTGPRVVVITSRGRTEIGERDIANLDWAEFSNVDLIVRPFHWDFNGGKGTKAYLKSLYVTLLEDELEQRYAHVPRLDASEAQLAIEGPIDDEIEDGEVVDESEEFQAFKG